MRLLIVRHGRTAANAARRLIGRMDLPLDPLGEAQAVALAAAAGPVDRVIASPLQRTRQTAAAFGRSVEVDERWIELDYGEYDGLPLGEVPADEWARWRADPSYAPPGGESLVVVRDRVAGALEELRAGGADETVVVVTHVSPIKAAVTWALGTGDEVVWRLFVSPASITRIVIDERGPILEGFNDVAHLDAIIESPPPT
jgi:probable phosphoglycerate mutase